MAQAIVCDRCGIRNPSSRKRCINCGVPLNVTKTTTPTQIILQPSAVTLPTSTTVPTGDIHYPHVVEGGEIIPGRPGCLTIYIGLIILFNIILPLIREVTGFSRGEMKANDLIFDFVFLGVVFVVLVGLWRMKNWARFLGIGVEVLGLLGILNALLRLIVEGTLSLGFIISESITVIISAFIIYWLAANGRRFS